MRIILLKDVSKVGQRYEIKDVSDGHALNFLIPRGLAKPASPKEISLMDNLRKQEEKSRQEKSRHLKEAFSSINQRVVIKTKANEKGHLFKRISEEDLSQAIKNQFGIEIEKKLIKIEKPIKEIGEHEVMIETADHNAKVGISVSSA